jgi:hypothetical protein
MKKNDDRFITAIFCDDIRPELGNKLSFMGCYQGEIIVQITPVVLPKLCVSVSVSTPKERPFKLLAIRVVQDDDVELARMDIPKEGIKGIAGSSQISDKTSTRISLNTAIVFSPFVIEKPTMLRLVATTEEGEITGPRLLIKVAAAQGPTVQPAKKTKTAKPRTIK